MKRWRSTAIGVAATALVGSLVVIGWLDSHRSARQQNTAPSAAARVASALATPRRSDINACNKYATSEAASVEAGAVHALAGTAADGSVYGLDESKKADERYRVAYASCMRARGFAS
jgi:hypothetical protein